MAMILNKLPRELRDQIYRELLVNVQGIKIADNCIEPSDFSGPKQLSPAILQPQWAEGPINLDRTLLLMGLIAKTGCSLKSLCLSWTFRDCDCSLYELEAGSSIIGGDERIPHAIAGLNMPQKIEIIVDSNDVGHYHRCEAFTTKTVSLLQWSTTNVTKKCIKRSMEVGGGVKEEVQAYEEVENLVDWSEQKNSSDETSGDSDTDNASVDSDIALTEKLCNDIGIHYVWTWTLAPTATMVRNEGSQTAKSLD
ncbi:MAG: hypothetical protein Q9195_002118 [Heterodermia aff. obscurata]